jgi:regulator of replication initiation timing
MSVDKNNATTLTKWTKNREIGTQMDQQQFLAAKALPTTQFIKELAENHRLRIENAKLTLENRRLRQRISG